MIARPKFERRSSGQGRQTYYRVLAGAVNKRARDGQTSRLRAIGAAAVFTAARAVATAREYLADDATRSSVVCVPRYATVQFDGRAEETTILEVVVYRVDSDNEGLVDATAKLSVGH